MKHFYSGMLFTLGIIVPLGWFATLAYEHASYEHYLQVIHGPWVFSQMGSGPVQLWGSCFILVIGVLLCVIAKKLKRSS